MRLTRSRSLFSAAALLSLLALLLPLPPALAGGGCCFTKVVITSLDTGRVAVISGPALTAGYDLSSFWSFADFPNRTAAPARSGPSYEVNRDDTDHLRYYPGVGSAPGVVYYEGLYNGSSEYDGQWFSVTPEHDAALRQVLAAQGLTAAAARQQSFFVLAVFALAALVLAGLCVALGAYTRHPAARAVTA
jgi:hypothetical protein